MVLAESSPGAQVGAKLSHYDEPIFAVADGTAIAARNDLRDQPPGRLPEGLALDEADGNFAIIDLGNDVYALYAHMRRGSVTVSAGQRVRRGEQIGKVGNSGNTQAPHLHFQLMDVPSALAANGAPYPCPSTEACRWTCRS
jgi:murein DD-endopeptidase MepM/ murein hydrolase activator NlpD